MKMEKKYSVSKYIALNNRKGFQQWLIQNDRADAFERLSKEWVNLDNFKGDRIPLEIVTEEISKISFLVNEPNLGLKVIALTDLKLSPFYKILNITIGSAIRKNIEIPLHLFFRLVSNYYQILTQVVTLELLEAKNGITLVFNPNLHNKITYHQIEGAMYGVSRLIAEFKNCWPNQVEFEHTCPSEDLEIYSKFFNCLPGFNKTKNKLVYNFNLKSQNREYLVLLNPLIHSVEKQFPQITYKEMIKILLLSTLGFIPPDRKHMADLLSLSIKTLQRRLREEGSSFQEILLETRKKIVIEYLASNQFTIEQISLLLGYKAKSQFIKAFNTWFGMSPNSYKASMFQLAL